MSLRSRRDCLGRVTSGAKSAPKRGLRLHAGDCRICGRAWVYPRYYGPNHDRYPPKPQKVKASPGQHSIDPEP